MNKSANIIGIGSKYLPTIGLEIHAELRTASKTFCSCKNDSDEEKPNTNVCPICLGHPGTLPVLNKEAIVKVLKIGIAVNGKLADFTEWDRKQYFYPDIPKGYQISQYAYPLVSGGTLAGIELERIHLEEDTAQSTHDMHAKSLINFNRSGVPLMELVTKPDIHSAKAAVAFAKELQLLIRYLGAGEANMEKGEMRVEANVSVSSQVSKYKSTQVLGTKTEVKNLNSFRAVEKAIDHEIRRQIEILERGEKVVQETRGWDDRKGKTISRRSKESAHDYRYFPEPDIPKMKISEIPEFSRETLFRGMPELPWKKRERFLNDFGATAKEAEMFVKDVALAEYFEEIVEAIKKSFQNNSIEKPIVFRISGPDSERSHFQKGIRTAMNYLLTDYLGAFYKKNLALGSNIGESQKPDLNIPPDSWAELISMIMNGELSSRGTKDIIAYLIASPAEESRDLAVKHALVQQNDPDTLKKTIKKVIESNTSVVNEYKSGKQVSLQYLIGQTMKATKGSANPSIIKEILIELLS